MVVRRSPTLMCCVTNHRSWAGSPPHPRCGEHSMRSPPQRRRGSRRPVPGPVVMSGRSWRPVRVGSRPRRSPAPTWATRSCWMWTPRSSSRTARKSWPQPRSRRPGASIPLVCGVTAAEFLTRRFAARRTNCTENTASAAHLRAPWCAGGAALLTCMLRTGKAGSNTAVDHITVLGQAIGQIPPAQRKDLLVRCDGAGASHDFVDWLTEQGQVRGRRLEYSVGYAVTEKIRDAISLVPAHVWTPASDADGGIREGGDVAELTGLLDLRTWPEGMRIIVRRERPHPGAQLSLFEKRDGWRYQAIATNTATGQLPFLEARHRAHARVEDRIRHAKDTGLARFPSREFTINQAWLTATTIAADLVAWTRLLAFTGDAKVLASCEPKALRYRLLHSPARLTHSARRRRLQIPETWPWAAAIVAVFANIAAIPPPA